MQFTKVYSPIMNSRSQHGIIGIQAMRFIAALAVVVDHYVIHLCEQGIVHQSWLPFAYRLGALGVFVFFAISGFVMVISNRNKFQAPRSSADFVIRRIIRIWPMYCIATIAVFSMKYNDPLNSAGNLLKSLAFIPYIGESGLYRPVLGKGWTLNYEMFFYAVFALCLNLPKKIGLGVACFLLFVLAFNGNASDNVIWQFYASDILLYFLMGVAVAYLVTETRLHLPHPHSAGIAIFSSALLFVSLIFAGRVSDHSSIQTGVTLLGVFMCLYLVCFSDTQFKRSAIARITTKLGDASYCLYLFHGFVLAALRLGLPKTSSDHPFALLPVAMAAATIFALLIHLYAEKPLNNLLIKLYKSRSVGAAQPALHP